MQHLMENMRDHDIRQWLDQGYVMFEGNVYRYYDCSDDRVSLIDYEGNTQWVEHSVIQVHWPLCGALNIKGRPYAVFLKRRQNRQWRRTFNMREVDIRVPGEWAINKLMPHSELRDVPHDLCAQAAFDPKYPSLEQAVHDLGRERISVALSPNLTLTQTALYHRLVHVANRRGNYGLTPVIPRPRLARMSKQVGGGSGGFIL